MKSNNLYSFSYIFWSISLWGICSGTATADVVVLANHAPHEIRLRSLPHGNKEAEHVLGPGDVTCFSWNEGESAEFEFAGVWKKMHLTTNSAYSFAPRMDSHGNVEKGLQLER